MEPGQQNISPLARKAEAIGQRLIPGHRRDETFGSMSPRQRSTVQYILEVFTTVLSVNASELRRAHDPSARFDRSKTLVQLRRLSGQLYQSAFRMTFLWLLGSVIVQYAAWSLLDRETLGAYVGLLLPCAFLVLAGRLQLNGITFTAKDGPLSLLQDTYRLELEHRLTRLWTGKWSPDAFPWQAALEAMYFVLLFFPSCFVVLQSFSGEPLPAGISGGWVLTCFTGSLTLLPLWIGLRRSNRLTARVIQSEIDALDAQNAAAAHSS